IVQYRVLMRAEFRDIPEVTEHVVITHLLRALDTHAQILLKRLPQRVLVPKLGAIRVEPFHKMHRAYYKVKAFPRQSAYNALFCAKLEPGFYALAYSDIGERGSYSFKLEIIRVKVR